MHTLKHNFAALTAIALSGAAIAAPVKREASDHRAKLSEMETKPFGMVKLPRQKIGKARLGPGVQGEKEAVQENDSQHIKSPQSINRFYSGRQ